MRIAFSERELDVMSVLWARGPSTAAEVREAIDDDLAYNTVLTVLRILEDKGFVDHVEEGRAHRFRALVPRETAGERAVDRVIEKMFGGSAELLMTHLVRDRKLKKAEIERLRDLLDERLEEDDR
jgi:BlaI family transcriptional regulator, penicillinase repressor